MTNPSHSPVLRERTSRGLFRKDDYAARQGILKLLAMLPAEQNNGYIWQNLFKILYRNRGRMKPDGWERIVTLNTLKSDGQPQLIHSGSYEELIAAFGLSPDAIARTILTWQENR